MLYSKRQQSLNKAEPFLKWAGGKGQLLEQYDRFFPRSFGAYYEPFAGSGAVFFHLYNKGKVGYAALSDANAELINVYHQVQTNVVRLIELLKTYHYEKDFYYAMRERKAEDLTDIERAARMIYLNRTCFNGLYRVNRKGEFNVPMGRYQNPVICQEERLITAHEALRNVRLLNQSFEMALVNSKVGDFIYFDPPYFPLNPTSSFTSYTADHFGEAQQTELAEVMKRLDRKGAYVMLSNSDTTFIRELYAGYRIEEVQASRSINSKSAKRGKITELLILNY